MKRFSQFIIEAKETRASEQAKKLGLVGDGHGDWYNSQGEFVAKTVDGQLKFFNKGQRIGLRDIPPKSGQGRGGLATAQQQVSPQQTQGQQISPQRIPIGQQEQMPAEDEFLTIVLAKFNPPSKEHKKLFTTAKRVSLGGELRIYPSRTQDNKSNPLTANRKIYYLKMMFPEIKDDIVNNPEIKTIFDVLIAGNEDGYSNVNIVVGSDRQAEIQNLANKYNEKFYKYNEIKVIPTGNFDSEKNISGISSGMMRKTAADNNFREFKRAVTKNVDDLDARKLFNELRKAMGFNENVKEQYNLWEIAPELDFKNLRENYIQNKIYKIGDIVENVNTGLVGKVIRRGTNYLICVTEEDIMFKSWVKDIVEYTEVKMDSLMRDKTHPNTLVGTLGSFKYHAKMTPGAIQTNKKNLQYGGKVYGVNFINKYKAKKASTC